MLESSNSVADARASRRLGYFQGTSAYLIWGVLPLFFVLLKGIGSTEVVAHRVIFSIPAVGILMVVARRGPQLRAAIGNPRVLRLLAVSSACISGNWLLFIWAVQNGHVLEGSLGYFLNPLVNVVLGMLVFGERLTRAQTIAIAFASIGVAVLAVGAASGLWISLALALSFGFYGMVRKIAPVDALEGLLIETTLLAPFALGYLAWLTWSGELAIGREGLETAMLVLSGAVTAVPLLLFAAAAKRLPYSTLGLLQYLAPSMQFVLAVTVLGERLTLTHGICFALIWTGLIIYAASGIAGSIRLHRSAAASARP